MRRAVPAAFAGRTVQAQRSTFIGAMAGRLANAYPVTLHLPPGPVVVDAVVDPPPPITITAGSGWSTRDPAATYSAGPTTGAKTTRMDDYASNATADMSSQQLNTQSAWAVDLTAGAGGRPWADGTVHFGVHMLNTVSSDGWAEYDSGSYTAYMFAQFHRLYRLPSTAATYGGDPVSGRYMTGFPWLGSSIDTVGARLVDAPYLSYADQGFTGGVNLSYDIPFDTGDVASNGILLLGLAPSPLIAGGVLTMPSFYTAVPAQPVTGFSAQLRAQVDVTVTLNLAA